MSDQNPHRLSAVRREEERVTPLELFFDLVLVLAITRCGTLISADLTWSGIAKGLIALGLLWWAWVGYAWLTSVVNPEEGFVRIAMFAAMAALLVVSLCVPKAFGRLGFTFAVFYGVVRVSHIALFLIASTDDRRLRRSVRALAATSFVGIVVLIVATFFDPPIQAIVWTIALLVDAGGPFFLGGDGWKLVPAHFAERHGLIIIIALGESVFAVGAGAGDRVGTAVIVGAILSVGLIAVMWWAYFDVVALVASRKLASMPAGRQQNDMARDSYSYLHFPMVASIVLVSLGLKITLAHPGVRLNSVSSFALIGGAAIYFLAHVAFRFRNVQSINKERLTIALALLIFMPFSTHIAALAALAITTIVLCAMVAYEAVRFAEGRQRVRHQLGAEPPSQ